MWHVKRSFAGSVNQFVFHGLPYSGDNGNTTWPVFTTFDYQYSAMHGPHEPAWDFYKDQLDFVARNNFVWQSGIPRMDLAFWQKISVYPGHIQTRTYQPDDLERIGYSYEYLSPDNFNLQSAVVRDGILAPDAQAFKALVVRANDSLTTEGVAKLGDFADAGLSIIFSGGLPSSYLGTSSAADLQKASQTLQRLKSLSNVHVTSSYSGLASTITSLGILPATRLSTNASWFTYWRSEPEVNTDYVYVYNDAPYSPPGEGSSEGSIEFQSTGFPYEFDAWLGTQTPILTYSRSNTSTTIPFRLAGNQSTIVAFLPASRDPSLSYSTHLASISEGILSVKAVQQNGSVMLQSGPGSSNHSYTNALGQSGTVPPCASTSFILTNWSLTVEHWDPPSNLYDIQAGSTKFNTTHTLVDIVPWSSIPGLQSVSGRGYYSTSFLWPPSGSLSLSLSGAYLDFGSVYHTLRVTLNGEALPPLDVSAAKVDVKDYLKNGTNRLEAVVATPLGNVLSTIWGKLETSGTGPAAVSQPAPQTAQYGLRAPVRVNPYTEVVVLA